MYRKKQEQNKKIKKANFLQYEINLKLLEQKEKIILEKFPNAKKIFPWINVTE